MIYIKVNNNEVEIYPYSINQLKADNPNTSFPENISLETLAEFGVYPLKRLAKPSVDYTKNVNELTPQLIDGVWTQVWEIADASADEITERLAELDRQSEQNRAEAYRNESDPLFFKWQRGEATEQEWLDKVAEIKLRYPKTQPE